MRLGWLALCASACTWEWNDQQPPFGLSGQPPSFDSFQKLNTMPAGQATLLRGADGAPWTAFCEFWTDDLPNSKSDRFARDCKRLHLVRLDSFVAPPCGSGCVPAVGADEVLEGEGFSLHRREVYMLSGDGQRTPRTLTFHGPGDPSSADVTVGLPTGDPQILANDTGAADVVVYWIDDSATTQYDIYRRDGKHHRTLAFPAGVDPSALDEQNDFVFVLTRDGSRLVVREPSRQMTAYSTLDDSAVGLGMRPSTFQIDDAHAAVLTVGADGFRQVALDGSGETVLSPLVFEAGTLELGDGDAWIGGPGVGLWHIMLDGSVPAQQITRGQRLITRGPHGEVVYSTDPPDRYVSSAGDGWIGESQFMQRGFMVRWSADGTRIRFLEHAATASLTGELDSVMAPNGTPVPLGLNVIDFAELPDGRILAVENALLPGNWNRLVVIDETAHTKQWVLPQTADFFLVPEGNQIIADVITAASGYDIYQVPAP